MKIVQFFRTENNCKIIRKMFWNILKKFIIFIISNINNYVSHFCRQLAISSLSLLISLKYIVQGFILSNFFLWQYNNQQSALLFDLFAKNFFDIYIIEFYHYIYAVSFKGSWWSYVWVNSIKIYFFINLNFLNFVYNKYI